MKQGNIFRRLASLVLAGALLCLSFPSGAIAVETPDAAYTGDPSSTAVLGNLDYSDMQAPNLWSKEAVYEAGALGVVKGYGNRTFGRNLTISKQEALAIAYRAAGREAEAQLAGEALNAARTGTAKKTDSLGVWYDGYLRLALNDGLISQQDYTDALNEDQTSLTAESFHRTAAAQRQEMAYWLASTLKLTPQRGQQGLFNNYLDWRSADPQKIPYIEAVLQGKIMSGSGGRFQPAASLTREQAAQIVKNTEAYILTPLKLQKTTGTIENISMPIHSVNDMTITLKVISIRNSNGGLDTIAVRPSVKVSDKPLNEQNGSSLNRDVKDLVVYKNGGIGNSSTLEIGDRMNYYTGTDDNVVRFVNVISNSKSVRYVAAQLYSLDKTNSLLNVIQLFDMDYPSIATLRQNIRFASGSDAKAVAYQYSKSAAVTVDGKNASVSDLYSDMTVILVINNNNVVTGVMTADFNINAEESRIVRGIVEENNPQLGYITLYNENGTGTGKAYVNTLRSFNYSDGGSLDVLKNYKKSAIDNVEEGDTAYLKLDDDGNVLSVSAVDNYSPKYGKVLSRSPQEIAVQYDDGTQQILTAGSNVLVIRDGRLDTYSSIRDGDRVRLLLNITPKGTALKEITVEGKEHFVSNIYKGIVSGVDDMGSGLSTLNLQVLNHGKWERIGTKGFNSIPLAEEYKIYAGNSLMSIGNVEKLLLGNEAYIAVEKDYGGKERAVLVSFRNQKDTEALYSDTINTAATGSGSFSLNKEYKDVKCGTGSIVVKNGRLVVPGSITSRDKVLVVANRDYTSGDFNAGVVKIDDVAASINGQLYRGRISKINDNSDFTVESFSQLNGTDWVYSNTPKTFKINYDTRLLTDDGAVDMRGFIAYGSNSYKGQTIYILADDTSNAKVISTAAYGVYNAKGTVYGIKGAEYGNEGTLLTEPDEILLRNVTGYNSTTNLWEDVKDMDLGIGANGLIFKNGSIARPSDIKAGDAVRVIKKEAGQTGTAFIVVVE